MQAFGQIVKQHSRSAIRAAEVITGHDYEDPDYRIETSYGPKSVVGVADTIDRLRLELDEGTGVLKSRERLVRAMDTILTRLVTNPMQDDELAHFISNTLAAARADAKGGEA